MLREMQSEVNTGHPVERKLHIDYTTKNRPPQLHAATDIDCCFMAILSWEKPAGPRITKKLWSNLKPNHAMHFREQLADLRERTDSPRGKGTEEISRETEDATDPMLAPQGYDVRQPGRVLELQNRPTDLSWHFPILMTIREEPFKNYRSRTDEQWKAKEDKAEEFKRQKMQKNDDGQSHANWRASSWSWYQPMTWTPPSWQQWSSDETRESSDWQPAADWSSSDQTRDRKAIIGLLAVTILMAVKNECLTYDDIFFRATMTTKITYGQPIISEKEVW